MNRLSADRGEMPFYPSDADRVKDYKKSYDYEKEATENDSGAWNWVKRNWFGLIVATVVASLVLLILSVILYFCLRTLPNRRICRKMYEIEIVSITQYKYRIYWAPENFADVEAKYFLQDLLDGTRIGGREVCNCSALLSFWQWWNKNYNHYNPLIKKFEIVNNSACNMIFNQESYQNSEQLHTCTAVALKMKIHNEVKELAFLAGDTGFLTVTAKKRPKRSPFVLPEVDDITRYLFSKDDNIASKIEEFFKAVEDKNAGQLTFHYFKPLLYLKKLTKESPGKIREMSYFTPYSETGYYVSLPNLVYLEKISNNYLKATKQLTTFANVVAPDFNTDVLKIQNYHAAVRGITNPNLASYYIRILKSEIKKSESLIANALKKIVVNETMNVDFAICSNMALSECFAAENLSKFILTIYNPSNQPVSPYIRLPVSWGTYIVQTAEGWQVPAEVKRVPLAIRKSFLWDNRSDYELVFRADDTLGFGFKSFYVTSVPLNFEMSPTEEEKIELSFDQTMQNWKGMKIDDTEYPFSSDIRAYESSFCGGTLKRFYKFEEPMKFSLPISNGPLVTEYETIYDRLGSRIVRSFAGEDYLEVEWIFKNLTDRFEIVTRYAADIANHGVFRIDGREEGLEDPNGKKGECTKSCLESGKCFTRTYYPMQEISINDNSTQLTIISELPQSGTSPCSGTVEFSVLTKSQDLPENQILRVKHWIFIGKIDDEDFQDRVAEFAQEKKSDPLLFVTNAQDISFENWSENFTTEFSGLSSDIPSEILILTFEPRGQNTTWTRLKNTAARPIAIALEDIFPNNFQVKEISFGSSRCLSKSDITSHTLCNENFQFQYDNGLDFFKDSIIEFFPFEIKSFILSR